MNLQQQRIIILIIKEKYNNSYGEPWVEEDSRTYFKIIGFYNPRILLFYKMKKFKRRKMQ